VRGLGVSRRPPRRETRRRIGRAWSMDRGRCTKQPTARYGDAGLQRHPSLQQNGLRRLSGTDTHEPHNGFPRPLMSGLPGGRLRPPAQRVGLIAGSARSSRPICGQLRGRASQHRTLSALMRRRHWRAPICEGSSLAPSACGGRGARKAASAINPRCREDSVWRGWPDPANAPRGDLATGTRRQEQPLLGCRSGATGVNTIKRWR
jgi:hypothetical protein